VEGVRATSLGDWRMAPNDPSDSQRPPRLADEAGPEAASRLLHWAASGDRSVLGAPEHARRRTLHRRLAHLRAAFVGDVRMSFLVVMLLVGVGGVGWLGARYWYLQANRSAIEAARAAGARDEAMRFHTALSRVQATPEANAELIRATEVFYRALNESGYDIERLLRWSPDSNQDQ
jgi:hypothetical protein